MGSPSLPPALGKLVDGKRGQKPLSAFGIRSGDLAFFKSSLQPSYIIFGKRWTAEECAAYHKTAKHVAARYSEYWHVFDSKMGRTYVCSGDAHLIHPLCHLNIPSDTE